MKITSFDTPTCRILSERISAAIQSVADEFGLDVKPAGGKFDTFKFTAKMELVVRETATGESAAKAEWDRWAEMFQLKKNDFGRSFTLRGHIYTVSGVAPSRKNAICATRGDGKVFVFPPATVRALLQGAAPTAQV